jgi:hypothetical protein
MVETFIILGSPGIVFFAFRQGVQGTHFLPQ